MGTKTVKMPVGMQRSWWAPIATHAENSHPTYGAKVDMGAARKGYLSITTTNGSIPGDDIEQLYFERFANAQLDAETDMSDLEVNATIFGHSYGAGVETSGGSDSAPEGAYAFIEPILLKDKSVIYRATLLYRVTAMQSSEKVEADTRTPGSFDPKVNAVSYRVMEDNAGDWRAREEFPTLSAAEAWLDGMMGSTGVYKVTVQTAGSGSVDVPGSAFVASGSNYVITFSTDPVALYDNGTVKTSSIASHKYTISSIAADHTVVAIWA